jgi:hypothetical protein
MAYATAEQLAAHLNLGGDPSSSEQEALDRAVVVASSAVDEYTNRRFIVASTATAKLFRSERIDTVLIDDATTVTLVEESSDRQSWATRSATDWWTEPLNAADDGKPITKVCATFRFAAWVRVTGTWGWAAVPEDVVAATLIKAAKVYRRKDSPEGMEGLDGFGVTRISRFEDGDVQLLLAPFRRGRAIAGMA